jgi:hypothetical protein
MVSQWFIILEKLELFEGEIAFPDEEYANVNNNVVESYNIVSNNGLRMSQQEINQEGEDHQNNQNNQDEGNDINDQEEQNNPQSDRHMSRPVSKSSNNSHRSKRSNIIPIDDVNKNLSSPRINVV